MDDPMTTQNPRPPPLEGVRVLDLTRIVAGPYATGLLADMGARIVKVEQPERGDDLRGLPDQVRNLSVTFNDLNRSKEGITLDLRTERGREILLQLLPHFDVLAENYAAGTLERWNLGWEFLRVANPGLVYASLSGFGRDGPYAGRPSYDLVAQAMGGLMALTGDPEGSPTKTGVNLADYIGGLFLALGILSALRERDRSGLGQHVDISNQDALVTMLDSAPTWFRAGGPEAQRHGNFHRHVAPYGAYQAKDGWVVIAVGSARLFANALKAIGREQLLRDPEFIERARNFQVREELNQHWSEFVSTRTCDEVERICLEHGVGFGKVQSIQDLASDPQLEHRGMFQTIEHPDGQGPVPARGIPIQFLETPGCIRSPAPVLGQDTDRILAEFLGLSVKEVERLRDEGVV
jgi:crotonobetainyl-CoA:carnitine CoA-transferase CaiB-like acyl-CoA transferase